MDKFNFSYVIAWEYTCQGGWVYLVNNYEGAENCNFMDHGSLMEYELSYGLKVSTFSLVFIIWPFCFRPIFKYSWFQILWYQSKLRINLRKQNKLVKQFDFFANNWGTF